jgi:hydrogenase expression/formation protein HypD
MKYIAEYRDEELARLYLNEIHSVTTKPWKLMEICGGQTHSLVRNGILDLLPAQLTMVHGPGCPVCVTSIHTIDEAIFLAQQPGIIFCSFGDMLRVTGSEKKSARSKSSRRRYQDFIFPAGSSATR